MKFLSREPKTLENKEKKISITVPMVTNILRFRLFDLYSKSTDGDTVNTLQVAEYIFKNMVDKVSINGEDIKPEHMLNVDLTDDDSAEIFYECIQMVVSGIAGDDEDADTAKK